MSPKDTLEKAYGSVPKEVGFYVEMFPTLPRGIRYYWALLKRKWRVG